jgi:hypothetical protein
VREIAVANVEGTSPRTGATWSSWDAGNDKENSGFAGRLLGTTPGGDDNGMLGTTPRYCGSTVSLDGGTKGG